MPARMLLLTVSFAATLATAQPDGGPRKATADAGTTAKKGTTVPDRPAPPPTAGRTFLRRGPRPRPP